MNQLQNLSCLIIDDSSTMRRIIRASLARCEINNVTESGDGAAAYELIKSSKFDLILTDWNMPGCDGLDLIKLIRQLPDYKKTPIIMVTTEQGRDDVLAAMQQGVSAYIVKPFTPGIIKEKIEGVLAAAK